MSRTKRALISLTSAAVLVSAGATAAGAAPQHHHRHAGAHQSGKLVTGHLNASGYTVVALGTNGKMVWTKARSFSLRPPAPQYTLQLINSRGLYAGPGSLPATLVGTR